MFQALSLTAHSLQSNDAYTLCDVSDALFVLIIALVMCSLWYVLDGCVILCSCLAFTLMMRFLFLLYLANGRTLFDCYFPEARPRCFLFDCRGGTNVFDKRLTAGI